MHRFNFWTGPTTVEHFAEQMRLAGFVNVLAGTERVWFDSPLTLEQATRLVPNWARLVQVR